jgi:hypothetical protein
VTWTGGDANRQQALTPGFERRFARPPRGILKAFPVICQFLKNQLFMKPSSFFAASNCLGFRFLSAREAAKKYLDGIPGKRRSATCRDSRSSTRGEGWRI